MILPWAAPFIADVRVMLARTGAPQTMSRIWVFKDKVQVIDLRQGGHVIGFDLTREGESYTLNVVQRGQLGTFSLLPGPVRRNRLLAERIPAAQVVPLIGETLARMQARIAEAEAPAPPPQPYTIHENALIVPPRITATGSYDNSSGVFTCAGTFIPEAVTITGGNPRHVAAVVPDGPAVRRLAGTHAFGGIFFGHFGHFITESTGRLWILGEEGLPLDSMVYVPKAGPMAGHVTRRQQDLLAALGIEATLNVIEGPTLVERLVVPRAGFGLDETLIDGSPLYAGYMRKVAANRPPTPAGHPKLYVSRSKLAPDRGAILGEAHIEALLRAEGYAIWHPQTDSPAAQVAHYAGARQIISMDASPLHLYAYVASDRQKLAIIKRRSQDAHLAIQRHIKAFANPEVQLIDALVADHVPAGGRIGRSSWGEISIAALGQGLAAMGMIDHPERWHDLPQETVAAQIDKVADARNLSFARVACARP